MSYFERVSESFKLSELDDVVILPQQRSRILNVEELCESIRQQKGLINPINIVEFWDRKDAVRYANFFTKLYGKGKKEVSHKLRIAQPPFRFLVAGERRLTALRIIGKKIDFDIACSILSPDKSKMKDAAIEAAIFQAAENIHERPNSTDESWTILSLYNAMCLAAKKKVTFASVADKIGRSRETVSAAVHFHNDCPEFIRKNVIEGKISYGSALLISRLANTEFEGRKLFTDDFVKKFTQATISRSINTKSLKKTVEEYVKNALEQAKGEDFFAEEFTQALMLEHQGREAAGEHTVATRALIAYLVKYVRSVKEYGNEKTPLGAVYKDETVFANLLEMASYIEEVSEILYTRNTGDDLSHARIKKASQGIR